MSSSPEAQRDATNPPGIAPESPAACPLPASPLPYEPPRVEPLGNAYERTGARREPTWPPGCFRPDPMRPWLRDMLS